MARVLNIGERLSKIVDLCPEANVIADIGCDHGYVSCELILENKAKMVLATEKSEKCLLKAVWLANQINIAPFISFRVGDGFDAFTKYDKIDFCIIAGMGGLEIIEILKNKKIPLYDFVLQPMNNAVELRNYLMKNHYKILVDKKVYENGKYYDLIRVTYGECKFAEIEIYFGKSNFKSKNSQLFHQYLREREEFLLKLKEDVGGLSQNTQKELDYIEEALSMFENNSPKDDEEEFDVENEGQTFEENQEQNDDLGINSQEEQNQTEENFENQKEIENIENNSPDGVDNGENNG